jgi:adenylylsulfate kinase
MIYWFTGQPAAGKTILADLLKNKFGRAFRIDGDEMRELFTNKDYTIEGRVKNVGTAQKISHYLHNQGVNVIVSLVSPYIDQREDFKKLLGDGIKEIYVHTSEARERDHFKAISYIPPKDNFIDIDTTTDTPEQSLKKILDEI